MIFWDAKVTLTTACNAKCATCPVWRTEPQHMSVDDWRYIWRKLNDSTILHKIMLNATGDASVHPQFDEMMGVLKECKRKWVAMTTNGAALAYVPEGIDELVISFNGGTRSGYERTTGLPFEETVNHIRSLYPQIEKVKDAQLHCLIWDGNAGEEEAFADLWSDFPGKVRISYKYDNQMRKDHTVEAHQTTERVPCDYLWKYITIMPGGEVRSCCHDFYGQEQWGNILEDSIDELAAHAKRIMKLREQCQGCYFNLCERCNYNRPLDDGLIRYVKE